ncbi:MAG: aminopeptidase P family protein [Deferribacterales bacterium]|nr:aminopeptidase P family protein [Deferribacterales bacterium]
MEKLNTLFKQLENQGMLPYFVTNLSHIYYLSNFTGSTAYILIDENGFEFITDGRYKNQIENEIDKAFKRVIVENYNRHFEKIAERYKKMYVDFKTPLDLYTKLKKNSDVIVDLNDIIGQLRLVKSENEIAVIKKAYEIAAGAFTDAISEFQFGETENVWAAKLEYNMKVRGARRPSFDTIIASGHRGALPHGIASGKKIDLAEPVIVDYGAFINYCSDITRMIYSGNDKEVLEIIDIVNSAKMLAIESIREGKKACEIDAIARDFIEKKGYGQFFNHGLGHGVGIDVHEKPSLNPFDETVLKAGMIITIEPGIYFENNFGVRIEDAVLVTENGCEILSSMLERHFYKIN